jgi:hypothetical protein
VIRYERAQSRPGRTTVRMSTSSPPRCRRCPGHVDLLVADVPQLHRCLMQGEPSTWTPRGGRELLVHVDFPSATDTARICGGRRWCAASAPGRRASLGSTVATLRRRSTTS